LFIAGPSGSGKSTLLKDIIANAALIFSPAPVEIIICYAIYQPLYDSYQQLSPVPVKFVEGLAMLDSLPKDRLSRIIVYDDLMDVISSSQEIADFYTKYSHHYNYSIITLVQNLFHRGKHFRTISLNCHHFWLLKSVRDYSVIQTIGRQMGSQKFVFESYLDAIKSKFGYLFLNCSPVCDDLARVRAKIFENPSVAYLPKS
jgi:energy-coupling factor transporter ATP-binding protein EcfA2